MAKSKKALTEEAQALGIKVDTKAKIADIQELINKEAADSSANDEGITSEKVSEDESAKPMAKAGKRSAKALEEIAEKQAKEERKASGEAAEEAKPKKSVKPARPKLERRGKKFQESAKLIEKGKTYNLQQAVELAQKTSHVKFDATVELHVNLAIDPKLSDQNVRGTMVLPAGTGKKIRIAAVTEDVESAKKAGADLAGVDNILVEIEKGQLNFDILIASPALMPRLGQYARVLGPRGLMPNPKSGTVSADITKAIAEAKAGRIEYRVDSTGIIHLGVGKVSFTAAQLLENVQAVLSSLRSGKPASVKSNYITAVHLSTSMGPSITVDLANLA